MSSSILQLYYATFSPGPGTPRLYETYFFRTKKEAEALTPLLIEHFEHREKSLL